MTPESLSREGSPGPEGIHLHAAPHPNGHGVVHMSSDSPAQVVASHMEVKTNHFPPGVPNILTGAQSKFLTFFFTKSGILGGFFVILATFGSQDKPFPFFVVPNILTGARSKFLSFSIFDDFLPVFYKIWYFWFLHHFGYLAQSQSTRNLPYINY